MSLLSQDKTVIYSILILPKKIISNPTHWKFRNCNKMKLQLQIFNTNKFHIILGDRNGGKMSKLWKTA